MPDTLDIQHCIKPHPSAGTLAARETKVLAAYYGGDSLFPLVSELRPGEDAFKLDWRRKRVVDHYENYPFEIAATYVEQVYRTNQIQRTANGNGALEDWLRRDYDAWFQNEVCPLALVLPECFIVVEPATIKPASRMDQEAREIWPRPTFLLPSQVHNYGLDEDGNVLWYCRKMKAGNDTFFEIRDAQKVYTVDDKGMPVSRVTYNGEINGEVPDGLVSEAPHGLPNCGMVRLAWRQNYTLGCSGHAFLHQVVDKSIACLQIMSRLTQAIDFHLDYNRILSPETFKATKERQGERDPGDIIEPDSVDDRKVAETRYLPKPSMEMDKLIELVYHRIPTAIYRAARLRDRTTNAIASGASKMMDAVPELAALSAVASFFQRADHDVVKLIALGFDPTMPQDKIEVQYPTRFDLKTGTDILLEISTLAEAEAKGAGPSSPTAMIELKYAAFRALLPDLADKDLAKIWKELHEKPEPAAATTPVDTPADALKASEANPFGAKAESPV